MIQNVDYQQSATIKTNPTNYTGAWGQILCLSDCTVTEVIDTNLTNGSEQWTSNEFVKGAIIVGRFTSVTLTGKVVLYA